MHLSFPQTHEHFIFLKFRIWIFGSFLAVVVSQPWPSCPKRYDVKEWGIRIFYSVHQEFKDRNLIDTSPYTYPCIIIYFYFWQAKTKADIAKKSSYYYSSHCSCPFKPLETFSISKQNSNTIKSGVLAPLLLKHMQIAYDGKIWPLCFVTFWQKVDFLISNEC